MSVGIVPIVSVSADRVLNARYQIDTLEKLFYCIGGEVKGKSIYVTVVTRYESFDFLVLNCPLMAEKVRPELGGLKELACAKAAIVEPAGVSSTSFLPKEVGWDKQLFSVVAGGITR